MWDAKLVAAGEALADGPRRRWSTSCGPVLAEAYDASRGHRAGATVRGSTLRRAVAGRRAWPRRWPSAARDDLRRGVSTVGPAPRRARRCVIDGLPARTHASQGEQRSLALALRLAAHRVVTDAAESPPVLLLDDVFSELDPDRSARPARHTCPPARRCSPPPARLPPGAVPELTRRRRATPR